MNNHKKSFGKKWLRVSVITGSLAVMLGGCVFAEEPPPGPPVAEYYPGYYYGGPAYYAYPSYPTSSIYFGFGGRGGGYYHGGGYYGGSGFHGGGR